MEQQDQKPTKTEETLSQLEKYGLKIDENSGEPNIPLFFKLKKDFANRLIAYLDERPMIEVEAIVNIIERCTEDKEEAMNYEAIKAVVRYLQEKCPRREVKHFVNEMMKDNGAVVVYLIRENKEETESKTEIEDENK